jgi:hypothetical protein
MPPRKRDALRWVRGSSGRLGSRTRLGILLSLVVRSAAAAAAVVVDHRRLALVEAWIGR